MGGGGHLILCPPHKKNCYKSYFFDKKKKIVLPQKRGGGGGTFDIVSPTFKIVGGGGHVPPPGISAHGMAKRRWRPTKHYLWEKLCICERVYIVSELRKILHFHILKLLFLSIFCWYFTYVVVINYGCRVITYNVPTNFQMYPVRPGTVRQNSENALLGGGGGNCPHAPPPSLATLVDLCYI